MPHRKLRACSYLQARLQSRGRSFGGKPSRNAQESLIGAFRGFRRLRVCFAQEKRNSGAVRGLKTKSNRGAVAGQKPRECSTGSRCRQNLLRRAEKCDFRFCLHAKIDFTLHNRHYRTHTSGPEGPAGRKVIHIPTITSTRQQSCYSSEHVDVQVFNNFSKVIHKLSTFFPHLSTSASEKPSGKVLQLRR